MDEGEIWDRLCDPDAVNNSTVINEDAWNE